jgi:hypothetical protein
LGKDSALGKLWNWLTQRLGRIQNLKLSQIGKNPTWILAVDDFRATVAELRSGRVEIVKESKESLWGVSALIRDLYRNLFSRIQRG